MYILNSHGAITGRCIVPDSTSETLGKRAAM